MSYIQRRKEKFRRSMQKLPGKLHSFKSRLKWIASGKDSTRIAFEIAGGMGDHILAARFIQDFMQECDGIDYDVYCTRPALASWIFSNAKGCCTIADRKTNLSSMHHQYLGVVEVLTFARLIYESPSNHRKAHQLPAGEINARALFQNLKSSIRPIQTMAAHHPFLDGQLGQYTAKKGFRRYNFLHHMADLPYTDGLLPLSTDAEILKTFGLRENGYITISNGYDEETKRQDRPLATKVYPFYADVVRELKASRPDITIVQLGTETSTPIDGVDVNLIGKTKLKEAAGLLQHSALHIDNEGGLVHLAWALGTRSAVVFGPTLADYFGYESNINIAPLQCGSCWWMEPTWMWSCVKGDAQPSCMHTQPPSAVAQSILSALGAC